LQAHYVDDSKYLNCDIHCTSAFTLSITVVLNGDGISIVPADMVLLYEMQLKHTRLVTVLITLRSMDCFNANAKQGKRVAAGARVDIGYLQSLSKRTRYSVIVAAVAIFSLLVGIYMALQGTDHMQVRFL
jgi:hypothetical protein